MAYLLRNDILNDIEDLRAELVYLIPRPEESDNDLIVYANAASAAMQKYLQIVSPTELRLAEELLSKQDGKSEQ